MDVKDRVLWHLDRDFKRPIRDPLWNNIYVSDGVLALINMPEFQQLSRIKQLGPSYLVYPGATHTRLAHSLGVFHIAYRMIRGLLTFDACPVLDETTVRSYLCAALLHDLGHFPFTHSLKELPLTEHEHLAARIITGKSLASVIRDKAGADPELVAAIIDESIPDGGQVEIKFFRRLLSGSLDPDKLDYLNRDAYFCGVPYGTQDLDFALSRLIPIGAEGIALAPTGISAVENILFSKYLMYRAVYWHRTVRVATAMIKKGLYRALTRGLLTPEELYGHDDESFYARFRSRAEPEFALIAGVQDRKLYSPVVDVAFDESNPAHRQLLDLEYRAEVERRIAESLSAGSAPIDPLSVVLDVPEKISFEVRFPVVFDDGLVDYPDAGTVFTPAVVADFTRTLRRIRLMLEPGVAGAASDPESALREALADGAR
ncbi:MAG: HD domain-containing protein [Spirochaetia bacterium]